LAARCGLGVDADRQQAVRVEQPLNPRGGPVGTRGVQRLLRLRRQRRAEVVERLIEPADVRRQRLPLDRNGSQVLCRRVGGKQRRAQQSQRRRSK
jgi:hypothetical protein